MHSGANDISDVRPSEVVKARRDFLFVATGSMAALGVASATWPLIDTLNPSAGVRAVSAVEVDVGSIQVGQRITIKWRGQPVFISHRTESEIVEAQSADLKNLPDPQSDADRVARKEWLVVVGVCTHLGCVPLGQRANVDRGGWRGWYCPCHGSHYDTSGRVRKGPAPSNLSIPDHEWVTESKLRIG